MNAPRVGSVGGGATFAPVSRESLLLANNILLVVACASVLLGTLYPLVIDAMNLGKISVGPPYFDAVFAALTAPLAFLIGVGPAASWRKTTLPDLWTRLRWAFGVALVVAVVVPLLQGRLSPLTALGVFLAVDIADELTERGYLAAHGFHYHGRKSSSGEALVEPAGFDVAARAMVA